MSQSFSAKDRVTTNKKRVQRTLFSVIPSASSWLYYYKEKQIYLQEVV